MSPWRTVPRSPTEKDPRGRTLWSEECVQIGAVKRLDREAGKTGKGILYFFPSTAGQRGGERIGQNRCVDLEDVVSITDHPVNIVD